MEDARRPGRITSAVSLLAVVAMIVSSGVTARAGSGVRYFDDPGYGATGTAFRLLGSTWPTTSITYGFMNRTADLPVEAVDRVIAAAFDAWAKVSPLTFTPVADCGRPIGDANCEVPQIRLLFGADSHGDDEPFDGPGVVLAHAAEPGPAIGGDVHFDEDESWSEDLLFIVAVHEIGHALGLAHTGPENCPDANGVFAVLCPEYVDQRALTSDDIAGIQALYGALRTSITASVSGKGTVTSSPPGLSCPPSCTGVFDGGATVVLSAASTGRRWKFKGWGDACALSGRSTTCTVLADSAKNVTATFAKRRRR